MFTYKGTSKCGQARKTPPTQRKVIPAFPVSWEVSPGAITKSRVRDLDTVKSKWIVMKKNAVLLCLLPWVVYSGFCHAYTVSLGST